MNRDGNYKELGNWLAAQYRAMTMVKIKIKRDNAHLLVFSPLLDQSASSHSDCVGNSLNYFVPHPSYEGVISAVEQPSFYLIRR